MTQDADALGNARLMVAEEDEQECPEEPKEPDKIKKLAEELQSRKMEWNQFCDHIRAECAKVIGIEPGEASKLKLETLVRLAKKVEDVREGRI